MEKDFLGWFSRAYFSRDSTRYEIHSGKANGGPGIS